jgi:general L-amino acid transport system permease protein
MENRNASMGQPLRFLRESRATSIILQMAVTGGIIYLGYLLFRNTQANLEARNIASGFGFLSVEAGLPISNSLLPYSPADSYGYAFFIGVLNTLYVALLGIIAATIIGVLVGIARVSSNWLIARLAEIYVEILRNVPLLLTLFFTYSVVLASLPAPRGSLNPFWGCYLNNRGLYLPRPVFMDGFLSVVLVLGLAIIAAIAFSRWAVKYRDRSGMALPSGWISLGLVLGLPIATYFSMGSPLEWEAAVLKGFNFQGGMVLRPEFSALMIGLVLYTAAFIGENVRSGIQSVDIGQLDAAKSFGVGRGIIMRRVILPQALRVIIPATTNDYTSLVKNSSLAVAIGYPDMVSVGGTIIGQNDQAIEIIGLWMAVYLAINLIVSTLMNMINSRVQLVER